MASLPVPEPPLADELVALRPWDDADIAWIARESRDPLVPRFTTVPPANTEAQVREFLLAQGALRARGTEIHLLAVERATGVPVGPVGLHHVSWKDRCGEVGYWAAKAARGRGLTTAAVRLMCSWALGPLGLERVELRADVENAASQRVAEKCGFRRERVIEEDPSSIVVFGLAPGQLT